MRKSLPYAVFCLAACLSAAPASGELRVGDGRDAVVAELGEPTGGIRSGDYELMTYDRGRIELRAGRIAAMQLLSEREYQDRQVRERERAVELARLDEECRIAEEAARAQRIVTGTELKQKLLAEPQFLMASPSRQTAVWRNFMDRFPEVPVAEEYQRALRDLQDEMDRDRRKQELIDLELRVTQAEEKARKAEQALENERSSSDRVLYPFQSYTYEIPVPYVHSYTRDGYYSYGYLTPTPYPGYYGGTCWRPQNKPSHPNSGSSLRFSKDRGLSGSVRFGALEFR